MLSRSEGASGPQIAEVMGWAPHTVRGFLAGLAKKGVAVEVVERVRQIGPNKAGAKGSYSISWLRVSGTTERPQIDQCERHQFHAVVSLLFELEAQQHPLELIFPREGALHA